MSWEWFIGAVTEMVNIQCENFLMSIYIVVKKLTQMLNKTAKKATS